ncbi:MAG: 3,4-dehydroadipyl-CoA semialdehyde dehydrogenase [Planctomycetes bacterium]|nr:3,4-dehydroadipyl-CoA semialdehyde dehydrogenase [Planctomycetota bacterium]
MQTLSSYVLGRWQTGSGAPTLLYNPATEEPLAQCGTGGVDMAAVLRHAREQGGPALRALGFRRRGELLLGLSQALHAKREELIELSVANGGNTRGDAKFDIDGATGTLAYYAGLAKALPEGNVLPDGAGIQLGRTARYWGQHVHVPRPGVAVHINAFNFPAWGMLEKMACALLAGMPVVEKPGTPSALVAWRIAEVLVESKLLPEGSYQFLCGSAGDLLDHMGPQDALAFTGSSATGARLRGHPALVRHNTRVNIEADSLNAAVLAADVESGSETYGAFLANVALDIQQKAGQKCTATRRVLVPKARVDEVVAELSAALGRLVVGDPADAKTNVGPLASAEALRDVRAGIERLQHYARAACGGVEPIGSRGYFVRPTLLVAVDANAKVFHEHEVFGPCASILPYDGAPEAAAALCNRGGGGLVSSVYSNDPRWLGAVVEGVAPWLGRVWTMSDKLAGHATAPGLVLPHTNHGGPGRAGGGEELGGLRGLSLYLNRCAIQGFQGFVAGTFGAKVSEGATAPA